MCSAHQRPDLLKNDWFYNDFGSPDATFVETKTISFVNLSTNGLPKKAHMGMPLALKILQIED